MISLYKNIVKNRQINISYEDYYKINRYYITLLCYCISSIILILLKNNIYIILLINACPFLIYLSLIKRSKIL